MFFSFKIAKWKSYSSYTLLSQKAVMPTIQITIYKVVSLDNKNKLLCPFTMTINLEGYTFLPHLMMHMGCESTTTPVKLKKQPYEKRQTSQKKTEKKTTSQKKQN